MPLLVFFGEKSNFALFKKLLYRSFYRIYRNAKTPRRIRAFAQALLNEIAGDKPKTLEISILWL
jgi:hypothetical protein